MTKSQVLEGKWKNGLVIGDEYYFDNPSAMKYVYVDEKKPRTDVVVEIETIIEEDIYLSIIRKYKKNESPVMKYNKDDRSISYPSNKKMKEQVLGCDTATFGINGFNIHTGMDGYYGSAYTIGNESLILLSLCDDMSTLDNFHDMVVAAIQTSFK